MAVCLIDVTKMLVLFSTLQYKVHKRYLKRMGGKCLFCYVMREI